MADTLGASYWFLNPGLFSVQQFIRAKQISHTSADNAAASIAIAAAPTGVELIILAIHATYEAAADTGALTVTPNTTGFGPNLINQTLTAGTVSVVEMQQPMVWTGGAGTVTVALAGGGTLTGTVSVLYLIGNQ